MAERNPRWTEIAGFRLSQVDQTKARTALDGIKNGLPKAGVIAINKTLNKSRTVMINGLTDFLNIKKSNLRRRTTIRRAKAGQLYGSLTLMGRPIGLINFGAVDTNKTGVIATVVKGESPIEVRMGFIATGKFNNTHVFQRKGADRLPIKTMASQKLYDLFNRSPVKARLANYIPIELKKQMDAATNYIIGKQK